MAISENIHGNEHRRLDAMCQLMQNSWEEFQQLIRKQLMEQQERQERVNANLNEMITALSRQVLQLANQTEGAGVNGDPNFLASRFFKVEFPRFDGVDVKGWIYKCDQFFEIDNTPANVKVKIASIHLGGKALIWHQSFIKSVKNVGNLEWNTYKDAISSRFGENPFNDPLVELMKLKQTSSVEQYQETFDVLLTRADLTILQAISCILSELEVEIQNTMRMFKPQSLHETYCLAKLQEATLASINKRFKPILEKPIQPHRMNSILGKPTQSTDFSKPFHKEPQSTTYLARQSSSSSTGHSSFRGRRPARSMSA